MSIGRHDADSKSQTAVHHEQGHSEFWYGWRLQINALAAAGFRVVAPDMRGYNLSSRPKGVDSYDIESWPATSATWSTNAAPSPRCSRGTTRAAAWPGPRRA